jgi:three-Cys-motif partner protein
LPPKRDVQFWETAKDWSQRKHLIIGYYLTPAAAKLRAASPDGRVVILDGFAGRGQYDDGTPGSPVLIGQLADQCQSWRNPVDLRVFNIEAKKANFLELQGHTAPWVEQGRTRNLHGTFREWLPVVLEETSSSPLFAFLDPFRPTDLPFSDFVPLLRRTAVTELCFVFHTCCLPDHSGGQARGADSRRQQVHDASHVRSDLRRQSLAIAPCACDFPKL